MVSVSIYDNSKFFFLAFKLDENFGGLTRAMLDRAKVLQQNKPDIILTILTFSFHPDFVENANKVRSLYHFPENIRILNLYNELEFSKDTRKPINSWDDDKKYVVEKVKGKMAYRYFENGLYIKYKNFEKNDNKLKLIDFFNNNRQRVKREEYDLQGNIRRVIYYSLDVNRPKQELLYTENGHCYISKWYNNSEEKNVINRIYLFDENEEIKETFNSNLELEKYWVESLLKEDIKTFITVDARQMDRLALSLDKRDNIFKLFVKHSIHVEEPFRYDSNLRAANKAVFNNLSEVDAVILLTEYQKKDVESRLGKSHKLFVIPHSYNGRVVDAQNASKDLKRVISIGRYHTDKRLDHLVKAFEIVVKHVPEARLELFGFGKEKTNLEQEVKSLNLQHNIRINDVTNNAHVEFANSAISVLTSRYEGFGLVVLESLVNGTPVISYDIKYGPSDMIKNGENGYLIKDGDIRSLAYRIINLLTNSSTLQKFSENARETINAFSKAKFLDEWTNLFSKLDEKRERQRKVQDTDLEIYRMSWTDNTDLKLKISGHVYWDTFNTSVNAEYYWRFSNVGLQKQIYHKAEIFETENKKLKFKDIISIKKIINHNIFQVGDWVLSLVVNSNDSTIEYQLNEANKADDFIQTQVAHDFKNNYVVKPTFRKHSVNFKINRIKPEDFNKESKSLKIEIIKAGWLNKGISIFNVAIDCLINAKLKATPANLGLILRLKRKTDDFSIYDQIKNVKIYNKRLVFDHPINMTEPIFEPLLNAPYQEWEAALIIQDEDDLYEFLIKKAFFKRDVTIDFLEIKSKNYLIKPSFKGQQEVLTFKCERKH
ncbi:Glycosyltransferase involved in cell wall bisynthesis [Amphibacillus marinus]|uniref:Glycosyltransferase involved in cell wall bisynthesis n=1 Tax=Amphibacillus marinus TaxID=872970 RepID=A0A1H8N545_9BACI|nr:glycosyltransferase [Amphibacillus marinus]SEO24583.1 Glycosyltransferase involved in cell wall bisynthesis [Amphibacillus marinus]